MDLNALPGDPLANAYVTVAEATILLEGRLGVAPWFAWTGVTPATLAEQLQAALLPDPRAAALIWATELLDEQMAWSGAPTTTTQALGWPRTGTWDPQGRAIDSTTIPVVIARATTWYALALLQSHSVAVQQTLSAGIVKRRKMGSTEVEYFQPGTTTSGSVAPLAGDTRLPRDVQRMLAGYGVSSGGMLVPFLRG